MPIHELHQELINLGICEEQSLSLFHDRVSDREDISVLRCELSGIIILSRVDQISDLGYYPKGERDDQLADLGMMERTDENRDTDRRKLCIEDVAAGSRWLDVGTGEGALLDALAGQAKSCEAIEPNERTRRELVSRGYEVYPSAEFAPRGHYDLVTLFHVLEHSPDPLGELGAIRKLLRPGGRIFVEVPHARDFLLSYLDLDSFKDFTLWSQHLLLHTRESLKRMLETAGFGDVNITGVQRHPLANHFYWLAHGRPGGHDHWPHLLNDDLDSAYTSLLQDLDATDTLLADAVVPQ